ncbi:Panacea domain-containing protein [Bosea sp. RAC05]|uniref:Panacea domain-containing protein n=1 Tax=Bosea sp. RAC05 TaxID=1842539 RepID=UPI00083DD1AF|nr:Panacea domain-containing protein [Bosea sp. RAC05]AOG06789.1 hypothetical protein BSY19_2685 [Bosea sp. RAC05]
MPLDFQPNLPKIVELLLYLAHRKPGADKYQAVKFFYLADREHLARYGRPITSERYFALTYGPVASTAKDLLERNAYVMRAAGIDDLPFELAEKARGGPERRPIVVLGTPKRDVDLDLFSRSDLRVFDEILAKYGDYNFDQLFKLTHNHEAYKRAWNGRGSANRAPMKYEEMIEDKHAREAIVVDVGQVASHL